MPGTYGDFVSGIISYSVEGFIDPCDPLYSDNDKYWNANSAIVSRNKYPLSLRGGGYEHVIDYTEFMLAHHIFLHYNDLLHDRFQKQQKLMFNTHTYIINNATKFRTINNNFTKTKTKCLTIKDDFDIIFKSVCNEYFTSHTSHNDMNWNDFETMFINRVTTLREIKKFIPSKQIIEIEDIQQFSPELISCYGNVDVNLFDEYFKEYKELKLDYLMSLVNKTYKVFFSSDSERMKTYAGYYDSIDP